MVRKIKKTTAESTVRNIRRKSRKRYSGEEKIRIVLEGLRGEEAVAELCRREGISESVYYRWSKEFMPAFHPLKILLSFGQKASPVSGKITDCCPRYFFAETMKVEH